ncbi:MAG: universal stress protein [Actinobacteria bacterium]|nr:universal stress protein [Actinomycetota bacterium]
MKRILVGIDGSEGSKAALRWAIKEAKAHGATIEALHAWSYLDQTALGGEFQPGYSEDDARAQLSRTIDEVVGDRSEVAIELTTVCELPARALIEASSRADQVVVGARGLGGFRELLLGSVSHQVANHVTCPVTIVKLAS